MRLEVVEKKIGSLPARDKGDSTANGAAQVHPATLVGHGGLPAAILQRPAFLTHGQGHPGQAGPHAQAHGPVARPGAHPAPPSHLVAGSMVPAARRADETVPASAAVAAANPGPPPISSPFGAAAVPATQDPMLFASAAAAPPPAMPGALLAQVAEDLSLRATILPERAVLSVDAGTAGELALHLRVKDGVTDVRLSGPGAETLDVRQQDLRAALAGEGLTLGSFDSGQSSSSSSRHADAQPSDGPPAPRASVLPATGAAPATTHDSTSNAPAAKPGVHVTA